VLRFYEEVTELATVDINWGKFLSRKFLTMLASLVTLVVNAAAGGPIPWNQLVLLIGAMVAYIVVEGAIDYRREKTIEDAEDAFDRALEYVERVRGNHQSGGYCKVPPQTNMNHNCRKRVEVKESKTDICLGR